MRSRTLDHYPYFSILRSGNGRTTIIFTIENKKNIFVTLREHGFGHMKINRKSFFFHRRNEQITCINFPDLRRAFIEYLISLDFTIAGLNMRDLLNEFHYQDPFRNLSHMRSTLTVSLTEEEQKRLVSHASS
ncbi:MAG: hypothetical protein NT126_00440 [Bacteroidetes bacterium]|nr:hypothetical protein [Bacteroidota bacterium]